MTVVKEHDVTSRRYYTGMLLILPGEMLYIANRAEEIFLIFLRPAGGVANDPVQLTRVKVNVDHHILMPSRKCQTVRLFIIPNGIVVKPIVSILTARTSDWISL